MLHFWLCQSFEQLKAVSWSSNFEQPELQESLPNSSYIHTERSVFSSHVFLLLSSLHNMKLSADLLLTIFNSFLHMLFLANFLFR